MGERADRTGNVLINKVARLEHFGLVEQTRSGMHRFLGLGGSVSTGAAGRTYSEVCACSDASLGCAAHQVSPEQGDKEDLLGSLPNFEDLRNARTSGVLRVENMHPVT